MTHSQEHARLRIQGVKGAASTLMHTDGAASTKSPAEYGSQEIAMIIQGFLVLGEVQ